MVSSHPDVSSTKLFIERMKMKKLLLKDQFRSGVGVCFQKNCVVCTVKNFGLYFMYSIHRPGGHQKMHQNEIALMLLAVFFFSHFYSVLPLIVLRIAPVHYKYFFTLGDCLVLMAQSLEHPKPRTVRVRV